MNRIGTCLIKNFLQRLVITGVLIWTKRTVCGMVTAWVLTTICVLWNFIDAR